MEHHHLAECSNLTKMRDDILSQKVRSYENIFPEAVFRALVRLLSLHRSDTFTKEEWTEFKSLTSKRRTEDETLDDAQKYMSTAEYLKDWTNSSLALEQIIDLITVVRIPSQISLLFFGSSILTDDISGKTTPLQFLSHFFIEIMPTFSIGTPVLMLVHAWSLSLP